MNINNAERAQVLVSAVPYIKQYNGKIVVVKYGGNAMLNETLKNSVMGDIVLLSLVGAKVIIIRQSSGISSRSRSISITS